MNFVPETLAPNMVTMLGFVFLLSNHLIGMAWCWGEAGDTCELPRPFFLYFAVSVFIYQVMDNLDGKQARKTNSSSALGELFDHGCDSLYMLLITYPVICSIGWSGTETFYVLCAAVTVFYASHWEEYHTNELILGKFCNPTEGQIGCMILFIFAYFVGPQWWALTLGAFLPFLPSSIGTVSLRVVGLYALPFLLLYCIWDNGRNIYAWCQTKKLSFFHTFSKLSPLIIHITLMIGWVRLSKENLPEKHFASLINFHGLMFSYLCDRLMIARITRQEVTWFNPIITLTLVGFLNSALGPFVSDSFLLPFLCLILFGTFLYYVVSVTFQLSHYLDIFVFKLGKPKHNK